MRLGYGNVSSDWGSATRVSPPARQADPDSRPSEGERRGAGASHDGHLEERPRGLDGGVREPAPEPQDTEQAHNDLIVQMASTPTLGDLFGGTQL